MYAAVIVFPGSNCDRDAVVALERASGKRPYRAWHRNTDLPPVDLIVIPGGFAYGDYLRAGAMAARSPIMREVVARAARGTPVLAICNGFQVATEAGLLPGALMRNAALRFVCKDVHLRVESAESPFTSHYSPGQVIRIPIAHADGNYFAEPATLERIEGEGQIAFRYCDAAGGITAQANPNGSQRNIAGLFNRSHTVLGLMPHPERLADPELGGNDGHLMFTSLIAALA